MSNPDINQQLMEAVQYRKVERIRELLDIGADPNYFDDNFDFDLSGQPTTPLRTVVFCISDALISTNEIQQFYVIAGLLLEHGADPKPAIELAEKRYGPFHLMDKRNPLQNVLSLIYEWR